MAQVDTRTSEEQLMDEVFKFCDAGGSVIQIRTREVMRTAVTLRKTFLTEDKSFTHAEWDAVNGMRNFTLENFTNGFIPKGTLPDFPDAIAFPLSALRDAASAVNSDPRVHVFVYLDPHPFIQGNPMVIALLQQYADLLPAKNVCVILVTPELTLGELPLGTVLVADMPTPNEDELMHSLEALLKVNEDAGWAETPDIDEDDRRQIAMLGLGMTRFEFETHAGLAVVEASINSEDTITTEGLIAGISAGKTEVVKQTDILELFPSRKMNEVGGMARLKDWVKDRADSFSDEAKAFGIEPPKGMALVGVPGGGKSLVAKGIAGAWGVPLIRLDFANVFSKYIGDSESRMRSALKMVSRMGRLVLFADEIDKGLGGIGSGGDSGTSSRVLGTFLTWMQENESDVFVILTANRIEGLPPELFRRGRLDAVFSVGLPTPAERTEVLAVHLKARGRDIKEFDAKDIRVFHENSKDYLPAEIESAVKDGLVFAFKDKDTEDLQMSHIVKALNGMVPMAVSHKASIDAMIAWAKDNATPVSYDQAELEAKASNGEAAPAGRRVTRRPSAASTATPSKKLH